MIFVGLSLTGYKIGDGNETIAYRYGIKGTLAIGIDVFMTLIRIYPIEYLSLTSVRIKNFSLNNVRK